MIKSTMTLSLLLSSYTLFTSHQWCMPAICDEYDPQQSEKKVERQQPSRDMPSLQHLLEHITEDYHGQNSTRTPTQPLTMNTPMRLNLSMEFSTLRESMTGISYSPSEHASVCERAAAPLSNSVIAEIDTIANTIIKEWTQAEEHVKNADLLLATGTIALEEQHHYRLKSIILGLNTFYKYRTYMIENEPKKKHDHFVRMLELLVIARISHAISNPINSGYTRKSYRYRKTDDFTNIQTIYNKLNHKFSKLTQQNPHVSITFSIDDTADTSQSILQLPTQPISIPRS